MKAISALIAYIARHFTNWTAGVISARIATVISLVAVYSAVVGVAVSAVAGIVSGIQFGVNENIVIAASWVFPPNAGTCIAATISAVIVRATFDYHSSIIRLWASAF